MHQQILFLSNGHGEDLNGSLILHSLQKIAPEITISAMPLVGEGNAYRRLNVPIIGPTQSLPSGGIIYTHPLNWLKDISSGLIGLTWRQIRAVFRHRSQFDLLVAVGDLFPIAIAHLTGRPYVAFIVSTSSYYEGRLRLPLLTEWCLRSSRCLQVFTRDKYTEEDLQQRGLSKAIFAGYPIMDVLQPKGKDLELVPHVPMIAILPGSRIPEALNNLELQLKICEEITKIKPIQFRIALVGSITESDLQKIALKLGWQYEKCGNLVKEIGQKKIKVIGYWNTFADIIQNCDLALGMAGTAVEQAVGLGKPVVQIPGFGPQFTYPFAEAQMRLLGISVKTIGKKPTEKELFQRAAQEIISILDNPIYLENCVKNGQERVGEKGGSKQIANHLIQLIANS